MLNLTLLGLQETRFRMEWLPKHTKTRGADKYQQNSKMVSTWIRNPWKIGPGAQHKTMLKNKCQKHENIPKNDSQMGAQKWYYFKGFAYWGAFGGPNRLCDEKVGPQRVPNCSQGSKNEPKMTQKSSPSTKMSPKSQPFSEPSENELQKWTLWNPGPADCAKRLQ